MKRNVIIVMAAVLLPLAAAGEAVSFHREVWPILRANCVGCHKPGKAKGGLDLTNHAALLRGGKSGDTVLGGHPEKSELFLQIDSSEPEMPKDAEPLTPSEIAIIQKWIAEGAKEDMPPDPSAAHQLKSPPTYRSAPAIASIAWSADPPVLAIAAWHEVVLRSSDGEQVIGRLVGESPRVESIAFSPDGKTLAVAGGAPSEFGEVQLWNVAERKLMRSIKAGTDCVYGISWSPDGTKVAVGCADKLVRVFAVTDGSELMRCDNHIDWVFATAWRHDGARLVSASRDRAIKLIDVASGHLIDDLAKPREPLLCLARHPTEDLVAFGSDAGQIRLHKVAPRGGRLAEGDDKEESAVREFERLPGPVHSLAFSPDGSLLAATGATGETRIWKTADAKRVAQIPPRGGPLFAVAFSPDGQQVALAGADGIVAFHDATGGKLLKSVVAVPLEFSSR
jgi:mono/diheme cytochrome c family protein/roadblock/LC7 domain-containing protein